MNARPLAIIAAMALLPSSVRADLLLHFNFDTYSNAPSNTETQSSVGGYVLSLKSTAGAVTPLLSGTGSSNAAADKSLNLTSATQMGGSGTSPTGPVATYVANTGTAVGTQTSLTMSGWFKTDTSTPIGNNARLLETSSLSVTAPSNGVLSLMVNDGSSSVSLSSSNSFAATQSWQFFAITFDGSIATGDNVHFYRGTSTSPAELVASGRLSITQWIGLSSTASNHMIRIGNVASGSSAQARPFDGHIDNLSLYGAATGNGGALILSDIENLRLSTSPSSSASTITVPNITNPHPRLFINQSDISTMWSRIAAGPGAGPHATAWANHTTMVSGYPDAGDLTPYTGSQYMKFYEFTTGWSSADGKDPTQVGQSRFARDYAIAYQGARGVGTAGEQEIYATRAIEILKEWAAPQLCDIFDYASDNDYSGSNTVPLTGYADTTGRAFSETTMTPLPDHYGASDYDGPAFVGGHTAILTTGTATALTGEVSPQTSPLPDVLSFKLNSAASTSVGAQYILMLSNVSPNVTFDAASSLSTNVKRNSSTSGRVRAVLKQNGQWYISRSSQTIDGTGTTPQQFSNLDAVSWTTYAPGTSLVYADNGVATFALANGAVQQAGFLYEQSFTTSNPNTSKALTVTAVRIRATAMPGTQYDLTDPLHLHSYGSMLARGIIPFCYAYDLVHNYAGTGQLTNTEKAQIEEWFGKIAEVIKPSVLDWPTYLYFRRQYHNNHLAASIAGVAAIGYAIGDKDLVQWAIEVPDGVNPRDWTNQLAGLILKPGDAPCVREPATAPPPHLGEIFDRYRHHTNPNRGLRYAHLSMSLMSLVAEMAAHNGLDLWNYRAATGETLRQPWEFYSDFYRLKDAKIHPNPPGSSKAFYAGDANGDFVAANASIPSDESGLIRYSVHFGDPVANFELALRQFPNSSVIRNLIVSLAGDRPTEVCEEYLGPVVLTHGIPNP